MLQQGKVSSFVPSSPICVTSMVFLCGGVLVWFVVVCVGGFVYGGSVNFPSGFFFRMPFHSRPLPCVVRGPWQLGLSSNPTSFFVLLSSPSLVSLLNIRSSLRTFEYQLVIPLTPPLSSFPFPGGFPSSFLSPLPVLGQLFSLTDAVDLEVKKTHHRAPSEFSAVFFPPSSLDMLYGLPFSAFSDFDF